MGVKSHLDLVKLSINSRLVFHQVGTQELTINVRSSVEMNQIQNESRFDSEVESNKRSITI